MKVSTPDRCRDAVCRRSALLALIICAISRPSPAQDADELLNELYRTGEGWIKGQVSAAVGDRSDVLSPAELQDLCATASRVLCDGSEQDLATLEPFAREALDILDGVPVLAPAADWLRARLAYLNAAASLVPAPPPLPAPRPRTRRPWQSIPTRRPGPETSRSLPVSIRQTAFWRNRVPPMPGPRASTLMPELKAAFAAQGVPAQLAWIAEVESSLNPAARSPAGAVGLFQLMPATAQRFGVRLSPDDERLQPVRSATAAARYLRTLHRQFGSWPLALAAYNAGEGRLDGALKLAPGRAFEDVAPRLPTETQMYVPRVLATVERREGVAPDRLPPPG